MPSSLNLLVLGDCNDSNLDPLYRLDSSVNVIVGNGIETLDRPLSNIDAILAWACGKQLLRRVLAQSTQIRWIHVRSAGVDHLLFPELVEASVIVTNGRGVFRESLAEFVLGAVLFFAKDFRRMVRNQEAGAWEQFDVEEIKGKTLGIFGYGATGQAVARLAKVFGMKVIGVRKHATESNKDTYVDQVLPPGKLSEVLKRCDYLVVSSALTEETRGVIGAWELRCLKSSAVLINVGRGPVVDEEALVEALAKGRLKGAAVDVFTQEPLPAEHPFFELGNVLLSPHCADHTATWQREAMAFFLENLRRFQEGRPLRNIVNLRNGY